MRGTPETWAKLPPLPHGWPKTMQIGLSDAPGGAAALHASAPFGFRYQYLAGGVNTGQGWATWNPGGSFASTYVRDSWSHGVLPVLSYYMLLQSKPGGGEARPGDGSPAAAAQLGRVATADLVRAAGGVAMGRDDRGHRPGVEVPEAADGDQRDRQQEHQAARRYTEQTFAYPGLTNLQ